MNMMPQPTPKQLAEFGILWDNPDQLVLKRAVLEHCGASPEQADEIIQKPWDQVSLIWKNRLWYAWWVNYDDSLD